MKDNTGEAATKMMEDEECRTWGCSVDTIVDRMKVTRD